MRNTLVGLLLLVVYTSWHYALLFDKIPGNFIVKSPEILTPIESKISNTKTENYSFDLSKNILKNSEEEKNEASIWQARAILLTVSAFYGTNFGCVKILGDALDPGVAASCRFILAALVFLPQLFKMIKSNPKLVVGGLEVGIYWSIGYWAQAVALKTTNASSAAFICSLAVIVVPIIDSLFGKKKKGDLFSTLIPALLAVVGVGCLELGGTNLPGIGDLWAFLQPLAFGLGFWRVETHIKNCNEPGDAQGFTGAMMAVVAVFALIWTGHDYISPLIDNKTELLASVDHQLKAFQDIKVPLAILWTGIVTTALTSYGDNIAMKTLSATESTVIYSTEPLWGTAFAAVVLGENIGWNTLLGAILVISACIWSSMGIKAASLLSPIQIAVATSEVVMEEVSENIGINVADLITKFQENSHSE